ncbi:tRNA (guanine(9)-N1)-methyltransferase [Silene latifolia]|uniref:tRNA (guanine(9)-N1)-methyltransferase n=1 Tax=Silene latifolia TaxID=37657 RepID=UPI003D772CD3
MAEEPQNEQSTTTTTTTTTTTLAATITTEQTPQSISDLHEKPISKNAQKKLKRQERYEAKKAEKKALEKQHKMAEKLRKQKEWDEKLAALGEEEKMKLIESRRGLRKERMEQRSEERVKKFEKLSWGKLHGQSIVIDLEFADLMTESELHSLVQQIMYCYAVNGRSTSPCHLWLTGCEGTMDSQLKRIPGVDKWVIEKESRSYIEALQDQKENLVYLTADSETVLEDLDPKKMYIIGGLVDRNRWKGLTMKKAQEQGIQTAKLPIGNYLKMSSSQVLTVNQVVEILLKYLEIRDWKTSFFQVIPQRKRCEATSSKIGGESEDDEHKEADNSSDSQKKLKVCETDSEASEKEVENGKKEDTCSTHN